MFFNGQGGLGRNQSRARELYELAAAKGDSRSQFLLASMHFRGEGRLEKSETRAVQLLERAAANGDKDALYCLG